MLKKRRTVKRSHQRSVPFSLDDNARILELEREVLRLRGLIDQHEKEAEARYLGRTKTAESNAVYAEQRRTIEKRQHDTLKKDVIDAIQPLWPLYRLIHQFDDTDE